jgi:hypothetical protein
MAAAVTDNTGKIQDPQKTREAAGYCVLTTPNPIPYTYNAPPIDTNEAKKAFNAAKNPNEVAVNNDNYSKDLYLLTSAIKARAEKGLELITPVSRAELDIFKSAIPTTRLQQTIETNVEDIANKGACIDWKAKLSQLAELKNAEKEADNQNSQKTAVAANKGKQQAAVFLKTLDASRATDKNYLISVYAAIEIRKDREANGLSQDTPMSNAEMSKALSAAEKNSVFTKSPLDQKAALKAISESAEKANPAAIPNAQNIQNVYSIEQQRMRFITEETRDLDAVRSKSNGWINGERLAVYTEVYLNRIANPQGEKISKGKISDNELKAAETSLGSRLDLSKTTPADFQAAALENAVQIRLEGYKVIWRVATGIDVTGLLEESKKGITSLLDNTFRRTLIKTKGGK